VIDHVVYEVSDLPRSARFYDAVFFALGGRRMPAGNGGLAWGVNEPVFEIAPRERAGGAFGHVALRAAGKAAVEAAHEAGLRSGGADEDPPARRPAGGPRGYGAVLRDPDGLRVELLSR
jgi:catechol 2,3-dioxygenase-like lactoylglutathione lyase family enzyme